MMKKKNLKKLTLHKEILYKIADRSLELIQGGRGEFTASGPVGRLSICC